MTEYQSGADCLDADELNFDCSDETIEAAASVGRYAAGAQTVAFCSGLDTCPA